MSGGIFNEALWGVLRMKMRSWFIKYKRNNYPPSPLKGVKNRSIAPFRGLGVKFSGEAVMG